MRDPIRVIEGNSKPHERFWSISDQSEDNDGEVELEFFGQYQNSPGGVMRLLQNF